jgi:hypothetical protein
MVNRILVGGFAVAVAGAAMVAISSVPASAFTLASPSLEAPVAGANVDKVWWDRWGNWHPGPRWGYGAPGPRWGYGAPGPWGYGGYQSNCWLGPYGHLHCR